MEAKKGTINVGINPRAQSGTFTFLMIASAI